MIFFLYYYYYLWYILFDREYIFMHMDDQVQTYCDNVRNDPNLANGYINKQNDYFILIYNISIIRFNAIGFSQGTLITRGYVERCNDPPVFNYIGWVGPQDGIIFYNNNNNK